MTILELFMNRKRILVSENQRILALYEGKILGIYGPGVHDFPKKKNYLEIIVHDLNNPVFISIYENALFEKRPDIASLHFTVFRTGPHEVAVIEKDGAIFKVLAPNEKSIIWTDAGPWTLTRVDVSKDLTIESNLLRRLDQAKKMEFASLYPIADGQVGLLFVGGSFQKTLAPGIYGFWDIGEMAQVKKIDMKRQSLDVTGQELLTRDRLTIRVNVSAEYRVVDPLLAVSGVKDFADTLYRSLQFAFRRALGTMTLDQILERKETVSAEAEAKVKDDMRELGIEVLSIELKDVILPGEMREILNQVVAAQKQAEANIIRRREETNATRSLLNTAKVMAENPVMLRLKELEALEAIAGKVERLTIHNGTGGLMNDIVRLRDN